MRAAAISSCTEVRMTSREFKESVSGTREVMVGTRWFDIVHRELSGDTVILRGHFDDKEGFLRQLISGVSNDPSPDAPPLLFQFYFNNGLMQQLIVYRFSHRLRSHNVQLYLPFFRDTVFRPPAPACFISC
jgi:hypothetical protein